LAILSLALSVVLPNGMRALDRMVLHSVLFEFQTSLGEARNRAFVAETDVLIATDGNRIAGSLEPRPGWTAYADRPLLVGSDGACSPAIVTFRRAEEPVMQVRVEPDCQARRVN